MKRINLPLLFFTAATLSAGDLKMVPQQSEVIQPESDKKENPNQFNQFQMSINIDNESASTIANGISEIPEKVKKAIKDTVNESMKSVASEMRASIADIVKETMNSMPKPEVVVVTAPTPAPTPEKAPRLVANDIRGARLLAKKYNRKLIVFFGNFLCPHDKDIAIAMEKGYVINPGEDYIIVIMDWLQDRKQISDMREFYQKHEPGMFPEGRRFKTPYIIIETSDQEILSMKNYNDWKPGEEHPVRQIAKDMDKYRYK